MSRPSITTLVRSPDLALLGHHGAPHARNHGDSRRAVGNFGRADGRGDVLAVELDARPGRSSISDASASCSMRCMSRKSTPCRSAHSATARYMAPVSI
jgi:hypothetical protein